MHYPHQGGTSSHFCTLCDEIYFAPSSPAVVEHDTAAGMDQELDPARALHAVGRKRGDNTVLTMILVIIVFVFSLSVYTTMSQ